MNYTIRLKGRTPFVWLDIGRHVVQKYRQRAKEAGYRQTALNLRKQGYPLDVTLRILLGR